MVTPESADASSQTTNTDPAVAVSPYTRTDRYSTPKEDHKFIAARIGERFDAARPLRVGDFGCGNGELIHHLRAQYPTWEYAGFDSTTEYINTSVNYPGLAGVRFECRDLFAVHETFDLVLCTGVANLFTDVFPLLDHLLACCRDGGRVFVEGLFNRHPVEVRVQFRDDSTPQTRGKWRSAFNQHSRDSIRTHLERRGRSMEFIDMVMDKDLPYDPRKPAADSYTFRASDGRNVITNGLNLILKRTLLIARKS